MLPEDFSLSSVPQNNILPVEGKHNWEELCCASSLLLSLPSSFIYLNTLYVPFPMEPIA